MIHAEQTWCGHMHQLMYQQPRKQRRQQMQFDDGWERNRHENQCGDFGTA